MSEVIFVGRSDDDLSSTLVVEGDASGVSITLKDNSGSRVSFIVKPGSVKNPGLHEALLRLHEGSDFTPMGVQGRPGFKDYRMRAENAEALLRRICSRWKSGKLDQELMDAALDLGTRYSSPLR